MIRLLLVQEDMVKRLNKLDVPNYMGKKIHVSKYPSAFSYKHGEIFPTQEDQLRRCIEFLYVD